MSYYDKNQQFARTFEELEVAVGNEKYYTIHLLEENKLGLVVAKGINNKENETYDYIGGINFNVDTQEFNSIVCKMNNTENNYTINDPHTAITNYGEVSDENSEIKCNEGEEVN